MPLRIPENHRLIFTEYICSKCDNDFYISQEPTNQRICPFCGDSANANGDIDIYTKKQHEA